MPRDRSFIQRFRITLTRLAVALAIVTGAVPAVHADEDKALHELETSGDFRVRVSAALLLSRTRPQGAIAALERALDDLHPAVRVAAAESLGKLNAIEALDSLEQHLSTEASSGVRAQLRVTIARIRSAAGPVQEDLADAPRASTSQVRCVVVLGTMRNASGIRGDDLKQVLADAARLNVQLLQGVEVVDRNTTAMRAAAARHIPIVFLDGNVTRLVESRSDASLEVHARVEFTVRKDQTLRGTMSGAATTFGSGPTLTGIAHRQLQDDAVSGAVQSALRGVDQGLLVAAR